MKRIIATAVLASAFVAAPAMADLDLAKKSGCLACHSVDTKIVGPAWKDVAAAVSDRSRIINSIRKGSKGNWTAVTGGVPMPPYSPRVSDENIEKLADFIMSLK
ncbi:c-type cytochrome [Pseudomonadota bacterium]